MRKLDKRTESLCKGQHLDFVRRGKWEFVHRPTVSGIVVVIAITRADKVLLVEQFRPPVNANVIELPAGLAGDAPGARKEPLVKAAQRELIEETGYVAEHWQRLSAGPPSAGVSSEVVTFYRAKNLKRMAEGGGDEHEKILVHEVSVATIDRWLRRKNARGVLIDPKVYAGLYLVAAMP